MGTFIIQGGKTLKGEIIPRGAKNEPLQVICSVLLTPDRVTFKNIPDISVVNILIDLLRGMGVEISGESTGTISFEARNIDHNYLLTDEFMKRSTSLFGSIMIAGPLLARFGKAFIPSPGGDKIGRGTTMSSPDIRAGVALLIAALSAEGESTIHDIEQIDRGYQNTDRRLNLPGADIKRL